MECIFGFVGDGFVILGADTSVVQSIVVQKTTEDKILQLDSHKLMATSGEAGDRVIFSEYIQKNINLYNFRNGIPLSTAAAASFTRNELAVALRKNPYYVNLMLGGFDKGKGPSLYFMDYIATLHQLEKGAVGYGSYFVLSVMDKYFRKGMSVEEGMALADKCIAEIRKRLIASPHSFVLKIVDKDGARDLAWRSLEPAPSAGPPPVINPGEASTSMQVQG
ncbi:hypothetical protein SELMODRAFT_165201 [Selaginella moellendorffii]|uniref:Proteasome subunit beta n=2 Tax=Selaginella moellendorffii TaxID=88036 RepID=D8QT24_SELML|nr:proteasome subunit beta type-2-B [Selaginella moellendorffii]EFJ34036.1 hypothetical protein SELMODRAFT_406410 [Selaginella moellendorffii]EFJ37543.1 hypothetical protein SELMODRAFT_165201 [Selaginella moellendorffii]|eukprot:XP_002962283.1 proteasome subunit beta type-2-B [Selaginella moellendorffii]